MGLVWWIFGGGYFIFFAFFSLFSPFFHSSPSLFCFLLEKRMWSYLVTGGAVVGVICMDGKHKPEKWSTNHGWDCLHFGGGKRVIEKLLYHDFISLGLEAWVILMDKPQHFWDVLAHAIVGLVLGKFLSFDFLSVVVISFDCLHDSVWITCQSVLCVNFIFPLCQCNPEKFMGRSLPFPLFLPICCGFHLFVLRVKGTEHSAQISTPLLENDAQFMPGACCKVGQPKNDQGLRIQEQWKIGICLHGEEKKITSWVPYTL